MRRFIMSCCLFYFSAEVCGTGFENARVACESVNKCQAECARVCVCSEKKAADERISNSARAGGKD